MIVDTRPLVLTVEEAPSSYGSVGPLHMRPPDAATCQSCESAAVCVSHVTRSSNFSATDRPMETRQQTAPAVRPAPERMVLMTQKSHTSLEDRLDADFPPAWRPEPGDKLVGEVVGVSERTGGYGSYPIVTLRCEDGEEVAIHAFRTVLASRLADVKPRIGEQLGVKYEGEIDGGERRYHSYKLAIDRPERTVDWSAYSEDVPATEPVRDIPADMSELDTPTKRGDDDIPF
jgi:hypothetical protein